MNPFARLLADHPFIVLAIVLVLIVAVPRLLPEGVDVRDEHGRTALMVAAMEGDLAGVEHALQRGADPHATEPCGYTPLMRGAQSGDTGVVARLLEAEADIDAADEAGFTPLMVATRRGHQPVVEKLLAAGADPSQVERSTGGTALIHAAQTGHAGIAKALLDAGADPAERGQTERTPAEWATHHGHDGLARQLESATPREG
ncbi:ankyrin repeat protein [Alkalispirillum mobile]|uniref:Ankyrin repeat protein n=1 Tax=Alkalispirillum mobile TaxID=85925 RepID=A0A498BW60_9GAMM|nr:ankyrin repeat domain-containing protein [Alkalispirillum mobile]RLK47117.1 ankyrin repeat protein [Alkalispirillum mobile]